MSSQRQALCLSRAFGLIRFLFELAQFEFLVEESDIVIQSFRRFLLIYFRRFISNWLSTITNIIPLADDGEGVIGNPSIMGPLIAVLSMIGMWNCNNSSNYSIMKYL